MTPMRVLAIVPFIAVAFALAASAVEQQGHEVGKIPLEFSNRPDRNADGAGGLNGADSGQVLYTEPIDAAGLPHPKDSFDYFPVGEVDALAAQHDYLFDDIIAGTGELLVSFKDDLGGTSVYFERLTSSGAKWTKTQLVNDANTVDDLDGMETHGPIGGSDANFYSREGEPGGVSVFFFNGATSSTYITRAQIHAALTSLPEGAFTGAEGDVDVDAMMVKDANSDAVWNSGDAILFSIREAANFHGGELVHFPHGGTPGFLVHGGHTWDTNFDPIAFFGLSSGPKSADAVDSGRGEGFKGPTLSGYAMLLLILLLLSIGLLTIRSRGRRPTA